MLASYLPSSGKETDVVTVTCPLYKLEAGDISHPVLNTGIDNTTGMSYDRQKSHS